ncbi:nucleoside triphosphate pyrophosphohydrolase [Microaerobacter geothermalis]|uniref:nucleoside triphosphate pyrophosphohydrolase n=1 Tax=Microaerobacter geothermalis TaxID=674972 RepID=UPI001F349DA4|nr:nucleoside triphosphate pyrophosphohydrolase [Microaerobacter geothermalis]MCF6094693.1 nucleoside triphosphate pyrophosphohydrolase [Microaerobacter geothermalis]
MGRQIVIVGLGAGDLNQLPFGIYRYLRKKKKIYARTLKHPVIHQLQEEGVTFDSFDHLYDRYERFEMVYPEICKTLIQLAKDNNQPVIYAVPGHPLVAEKTVQLLLSESGQHGITVDIKGGQSFLDSLFTRLKIDPIEGFHLLDAVDLKKEMLNPYLHTIIAQVYDKVIASDVKLTLMEVYPDDYQVIVATAIGIDGLEEIQSIPLYELDRLMEMTNLTVVYVPPASKEEIFYKDFNYLKGIVSILRSPEGCPWDREQTHKSLKKYLLEEAYEVLEAIDDEDDESLVEELGDLLLQVMLHAQIAEENGYFSIEDVIFHLNKKLIRRHPHVFSIQKVRDSEEVVSNWDAIKALEKTEKEGQPPLSVLDGIPKGLPALMDAIKLQKRAAKVGFDWEREEEVLAKVNEEFTELIQANTQEEKMEEFGDLLFALVNLARFLHIDPEEALMMTNRKFRQRFRYIEKRLSQGSKEWKDTNLEEMELLWQEAKKDQSFS